MITVTMRAALLAASMLCPSVAFGVSEPPATSLLGSNNTWSGTNTFLTTMVGPCDILNAAGNTCVEAHSFARRMLHTYSGNLFKLYRASDSTATDVGTASTGLVNFSTINAFLSGTDGYIGGPYDQTGHANNLLQTTLTAMAPYLLDATYGIPRLDSTHVSAYYDNLTGTTAMPTGTASKTVWEVLRTDIYGIADGHFGLSETNKSIITGGSMFSLENLLYLGCRGTGVDIEAASAYACPSSIPQYMLVIAKYDSATNITTIVAGDATTGVLQVLSAKPPSIPLVVEAGITMCEGGDGTFSPCQSFEGGIALGATSVATDQAIAANVKAFLASRVNALTPGPIDIVYNSGSAGVNVNPQKLNSSPVMNGAYGVRCLRSSMTHNIMTLTRASDSTSVNIGCPDGVNIDVATAATFCNTTIASNTAASITGTTLTLTGSTTGVFATGQVVLGYGVNQAQPATVITAGSGTSWTVFPGQTLASTKITTTTACGVKLLNQAITYQNNNTNPTVFDLPVTTTAPLLGWNGPNGRPAVCFRGTEQLVSQGITSLGPTHSIIAVGKRYAAAGAGKALAYSNGNQFIGWNSTPNVAVYQLANANVITAAATDDIWHQIVGSITNADGSASLQVDNGTATTQGAGAFSFQSVQVSAGSNTGSEGFCLEEMMGAYPALTAAQITALYTNQKTYYGVIP